MVNCALVLVMKLKWFFGITRKWPIECWILALSLLLLILHTCSTCLEITPFLFWSLTIPPPSGVPSTSSRECRWSMEIFWKWYLCKKILQEHLLDQLRETSSREWKIIKECYRIKTYGQCLIPASINSGRSWERGEGSGGKFSGLKGEFLWGAPP